MVSAAKAPMDNTVYAFLQKYFNEGQQRTATPPVAQEPHKDSTWLARQLVWRRPRWAGIAIPAFFVHLFWWSYMVNNSESFALFGKPEGGEGASPSAACTSARRVHADALVFCPTPSASAYLVLPRAQTASPATGPPSPWSSARS